MCTMVSFDSTMRSNISVGLPIDLLVYETDSLHQAAAAHRGDGRLLPDGAHAVGEGLRRVFAQLPDPGLDVTAAPVMAIRVAAVRTARPIGFDRHVNLGPHEIRLRPAPHAARRCWATRSTSRPEALPELAAGPYGNWVARLVSRAAPTTSRSRSTSFADLTVINPFDFFVEEYAEKFRSVRSRDSLAKELLPFLETGRSAASGVARTAAGRS